MFHFVMTRWLLRVILVMSVVSFMGVSGVAAAPERAPGPADQRAISASEYSPSSEEYAFLNLINDYRQRNGVGTLQLSWTLGAAAEHHSQDMASKNYFSHTLANGTSWAQNIRNHGYTYDTRIAENIAAGEASAEGVFQQWKNSPTHNTNMLDPRFEVIGIGLSTNTSAQYDHYWTTTFGGYAESGSAPSRQTSTDATVEALMAILREIIFS